MVSLDQWHDYVRVVTFFISLYSFVVLVGYYFKYRNTWNTRTKDFWYMAVMWAFTGCVLPVQGVYLDRPFTAAFVSASAAIFVMGKAVHSRGPWGHNSEPNV